MTEMAPVEPTKNLTEARGLYRAAGRCLTLWRNGHALTRAVPGGAAGRLPASQQEAEDEAVERSAEAHPVEPEGTDRQAGASGGGEAANPPAQPTEDLRRGTESAPGVRVEDFRFPLWTKAGGDPSRAGGPLAESGRAALQRAGGPGTEGSLGANAGPAAGTRAGGAAVEAAAAAARAPLAVSAGAGQVAQRMGPGATGQLADGLRAALRAVDSGRVSAHYVAGGYCHRLVGRGAADGALAEGQPGELRPAAAALPVPSARSAPRQRLGPAQRTALEVLPQAADGHVAEPAVREERQRLGGAEELDARTEASGLPALRHRRGAGGAARTVSVLGRVSELLSAHDEAEEEDAGGWEGASRVRGGQDTLPTCVGLWGAEAEAARATGSPLPGAEPGRAVAPDPRVEGSRVRFGGGQRPGRPAARAATGTGHRAHACPEPAPARGFPGLNTSNKERRANYARRASRFEYTKASAPRLHQSRGAEKPKPPERALWPGLTGGLAPSASEPAPSHRPLYLPQERDSLENQFDFTERRKRRSVRSYSYVAQQPPFRSPR